MTANYPKEANPSSKISAFGSIKCQMISGLPILVVRDSAKNNGPEFDIVDEALYHMRTNIFMRDFPAKTGADRLIIYLTFYGMKCLKFFAKNKKDKAKCQLEIDGWNLKPFPIPGEGGFIIDSYVTAPKNENEKRQLRDYFKKLRIEMGNRLLQKVFATGAEADKWWVCFSNKKLLDKEMAN
ncbi:hypothetical protein TVAG_205590 [Trichomonas vaginalis G3]|uniref:Actin-related protein 2/3 complex subunit 3 n=1 Tax=Trichomonas vaginalis (strain ATCC PRA-98 / G3) TaxID=412133 RepID=A2FJE8_TRIV3|nr:Arp2/3 complex-mediated actin nucleation [Trichomonas vaginalis G3]EAX94961.1 hypothetical protein TVAG_205590 [Trichomonas vaginalis G3]KAI5501513.1 Arp2/3 complex-mediated actin nucleation [Trichomonas vaginalis G3]|eukprot:XP_001307891.1 hypothetical protein [Trichomonas vaginalis G3]